MQNAFSGKHQLQNINRLMLLSWAPCRRGGVPTWLTIKFLIVCRLQLLLPLQPAAPLPLAACWCVFPMLLLLLPRLLQLPSLVGLVPKAHVTSDRLMSSFGEASLGRSRSPAGHVVDPFHFRVSRLLWTPCKKKK